MYTLKTGKPPWLFMSKLLELLPTSDIDLVMGPSQGEDAAVLRLRDGFLVIHSDPITTGVKRAGYLAVHVAANDVAIRGVRPRWFLPVVLIPPSFTEQDVAELFEDMSKALREVEGVVIGGHTEVTPGINRPFISMTSAGYTTGRVILTRDARPGNLLYIIGRVGGEGAGIIAWDFEDLLVARGLDRLVIEKAKNYIYQISVMNTALSIKDYVSSMHDATEGGVIQAIREMAVASSTRAVVNIDDVFIEETVRDISRAVSVDPLKLLSSGCIVASVPRSLSRDLESALQELGVTYSRVGFLEPGSGEVVLTREGEIVEVVVEDVIDEIYKLWNHPTRLGA
ncbi:MAG: AIR synthase related protein [Desulfurococcaceae archaeon]|nr:AIR synthase related protein [Desulfurococcaceae archaeon]